MVQTSSFRARPLARVVALVLLVIAALCLRPDAAWASHIRAGDIQAKVDTTADPRSPLFNARRIFFKMVLYSTATGVDEEKVTIFFGDGTSSCKQGVDRIPGGRRPIPGSPDMALNIYLFEHTFPAAGTYTISYIGENRVGGVLNMDDSINRNFFISTTITLNPLIGLNRSPILTAPAVDRGAVRQVFLHNPAAFDADGDSLSYSLIACQYEPRGVDGTVGGAPCTGAGAGTGNNRPVPVTCPGYQLPTSPGVTPGSTSLQVAYGGIPPGVPGAPGIFQIDPRTGQITWNSPDENGVYNVALQVTEWRRFGTGRLKIGEVIRDMQIVVAATENLRPTITIPADICVVAGQRVTGTVTATDGVTASSPRTAVTLFAYSGIIPPATFVQTQTGPPTAQGTFNWLTTCSSVAQQPYLVVFKAQDNPSPPTPTNPALTDERVWRITVVGPPPQNLRASAAVGTGGNPNSVDLSWNVYQCANASRIYIYRKVGPSGFVPGPCDTGIPPSAGYTLVADVPATATSFTDFNTVNNTRLGLDRGQTYCYRIYADFQLPKGGASIASAEACASFPGRAAMLTNVDVETTSTTGRIAVRWTQPRTAPGGTFEGTPTYVLSRAPGLNPAATAFAPVRAPFTALTDTSYVDTNLNTQDLQYTYRLEFVRTFAPGDGRPPASETSPLASSVRTSAVPANLAGTAIRVSWTYNVPWDNTAQPVRIYRRGPGPGGSFVQVATAPTGATGGTYTDVDLALRKDETYCYYVQTNGRYANLAFLSSLLNRSQERCVLLTSPPCTPVLALQPTNCDSLASLQEFPRLNQTYTNRLRWRLGTAPAGCDTRVASYNVFYRSTATGRFTLLGTTAQSSFVHSGLDFSGGCYAVQAVTASGLASDTSNVACQDNCVFFKLPNIFTPTGDGINDTFRPKNSSPIRSIRFQAYNRWGVKVFENTTTTKDRVFINWDGGGPVGESVAGKKVSDGIYYYLAEVEFADFANTKRTFKGWVEIVR